MNLIPLSVFVATCPHVCGVQFTGIFTWPRRVRSATCTLRLDQKSSCLKRKDICQVHIGGKGHAKLHMSHTGPYIPCISAQQTTWVMSPIPSIRITARYHMNDNDKLGWAPNQSWPLFWQRALFPPINGEVLIWALPKAVVKIQGTPTPLTWIRHIEPCGGVEACLARKTILTYCGWIVLPRVQAHQC